MRWSAVSRHSTAARNSGLRFQPNARPAAERTVSRPARDDIAIKPQPLRKIAPPFASERSVTAFPQHLLATREQLTKALSALFQRLRAHVLPFDLRDVIGD